MKDVTTSEEKPHTTRLPDIFHPRTRVLQSENIGVSSGHSRVVQQVPDQSLGNNALLAPRHGVTISIHHSAKARVISQNPHWANM